MLIDPIVWDSDEDVLDDDPPITDAEREFLKCEIVNSGWQLVPWSEAEIQTLMELVDRNMNTSSIGLLLGRSPLDVILELEELYSQKYARIKAKG